MSDTAAKRSACALNFGEPKKNKHDNVMQFAKISVQMSCRSPVKFQVGIMSLGALYCESIALVYSEDEESNGSMNAEVDIKENLQEVQKTTRQYKFFVWRTSF